MSQTTVNVTIRGRNFPITCERGEEEGIKDLARDLDQRLKTMQQAAPHASETQVSILTMLTIAAELKQAQDAAQPAAKPDNSAIEAAAAEASQAAAATQAATDAQMLEALKYFETKIDGIEKKLAS